jgi:maleate isomerase
LIRGFSAHGSVVLSPSHGVPEFVLSDVYQHDYPKVFAVTTLPRVGILIPSTDTTVEKELPTLLRGHASCHFARMKLTAVTHEGLRAMEADALRAAEVLADAQPNVVLFACTSGTFIFGADYEADLVAKLARAAGACVVTTARAMAEMLLTHGTTVRLRTPYESSITQAEVTYLRSFGLTASSHESLGLTLDNDIAAVSAERLIDFVKGSDAPDVVMLSCTNLQTLHVLDDLTAAAGAPIVTSNLAAAQTVRTLL